MKKLNSKHFLTGEELSRVELENLLDYAKWLKDHRDQGAGQGLLAGKSLALLFDKPSLRTRMSFFIAMNELGGNVIESLGANRKDEAPQDLARVLSGYCHAVMVRTFDDEPVKKMAEAGSVPVINGLTDQFHPCQTLADLLTLKEEFGSLKGLKLAYIGDGNNTLQSFFPVVAKVGMRLSYSCPQGYGPQKELFDQYVDGENIISCKTPEEAVKGADAVYTDVWASMGFEKESAQREKAFKGFQVNEALLEKSDSSVGDKGWDKRNDKKRPRVMHCLPMNRGQEISEDLPDQPHSLIFKQSENRLHVQKALLVGLLTEEKSGCQSQLQLSKV